MYPVVEIYGKESTSKYTIAKYLSLHFDLSLYLMSSTVFSQLPNDIEEIRHCWEREALLNKSLLVIEYENNLEKDYNINFKLFQFAKKKAQTPLIIFSNNQIKFPEEFLISFNIKLLNFLEQTSVWKSCLNQKITNLEINQLVSQFNLSNDSIQSICRQLEIEIKSNNKKNQNQNKNKFKEVWNICRYYSRVRLEELTNRVEVSANWNDLVLPVEQYNLIEDVVICLKQKFKVYQEWEFCKKGNRGHSITVLFYGESGTGKTMAAEVIASELCLDLYSIDLSRVVSKYVGETEKRLEEIFSAAESGGAILLFDKADALFSKRVEVQDSHNYYANIQVSYLLQRIEMYKGLSILTTNFKDNLDSAFERRIQFMINFPFPNANLTTKIWRQIFLLKTPTFELNYELLGQLKVSGGNIRNIALNSAFIAANLGGSVTMNTYLMLLRKNT
jgi:SpoVK/Ycf46/Vps4 family AAA+-type ATPase